MWITIGFKKNTTWICYRSYLGLTLVGFKRLSNVEDVLRLVFTRNISGDFVETGVWRGGMSVLIRSLENAFLSCNTFFDNQVLLFLRGP